MAVISRTFQINFEHRVYFTDRVFGVDNPLLRQVLKPATPGGASDQPAKALVIVDAALAAAQRELGPAIETYFASQTDALQLVCPLWPIAGGEQAKNSFAEVHQIHAQIERFHLDRHSYVIAIGGGALLDVAGFAAATAHRGIRHIRVPSTVLAQSDSGIGVKNGVNAFGKKNWIGTFTLPYAVINDFQLLASLPERDRRAGMVEAVKVAAIRDRTFFEELEQNASMLEQFEPAATRRLIRRCAELHFDHITTSGDPFELGSARPLDFGHWAAHKLEQLSGYRLRHGEAVAVGIAIDTIYSHRIGWLDGPSTERVLGLLKRLGFKLCPAELNLQDAAGNFQVLEGLQEFREHLGGNLTITLLRAIGQGCETTQVDMPALKASIGELIKMDARPSK